MRKLTLKKMSVLACALGLACLPALHAECHLANSNRVQVNSAGMQASDESMRNQSTSAAVNSAVDDDEDDSDMDDDNVSDVRTDAEISEDIQGKIGPGVLSSGYDRVSAQVTDGNVVLTGAVKTAGDKESLEKDIRDLDGVKSLNSTITVDDASTVTKAEAERDFSQDKHATAADEQLNKKIRDNVSRGYLWNSYKDITLDTNNGVVTLHGPVDEVSDQEKLVTEIQKVEGVKSVTSDLTIKNR